MPLRGWYGCARSGRGSTSCIRQRSTRATSRLTSRPSAMSGMPTSQTRSEPPVENTRRQQAPTHDGDAEPEDDRDRRPPARRLERRAQECADERSPGSAPGCRALRSSGSVARPFIGRTLAKAARPGIPGPRREVTGGRSAGHGRGLGRAHPDRRATSRAGGGSASPSRAVRRYPNRVAIAPTKGTMPAKARTITPTSAAANGWPASTDPRSRNRIQSPTQMAATIQPRNARAGRTTSSAPRPTGAPMTVTVDEQGEDRQHEGAGDAGDEDACPARG